MKWICLIFALLALASAQDKYEECQKKLRQIARNGYLPQSGRIICRLKPCNETEETEWSEGERCPNFCRMNNGVCYNKILPASAASQGDNSEADLLRLAALGQQASQAAQQSSSSTDDNVEERLFSLGGNTNLPIGLPSAPSSGFPSGFPAPPPFTGSGGFSPIPQPNIEDLLNGFCRRNSFPNSCNLNYNNPAQFQDLLQAPVDIPYCLRIPCRINDPTLDVNRFNCLSKPGCYFDDELFRLRRGFPYTILPGVPVCHLAVRNVEFQLAANQYIQTSQQPWNVLHTKCLIQENLIQIQTPPPGCYMLQVLQYSGFRPKQAGWAGITRDECYLIGGCFIASINPSAHKCFYPSQTSGVTVRAGEDEFRSLTPSQSDTFGQQRCLPWAQDTPQDYLESYHSCRQSGCVVDSSVGNPQLQQHLFDFTLNSVPPELRPQFWALVSQGDIHAGNFQSELQKLIDRNNLIQSLGYPTGYGPNFGQNLVNTQVFDQIVAFKLTIDDATEDTTGRNLYLNPQGGFNPSSVSFLPSLPNTGSIPNTGNIPNFPNLGNIPNFPNPGSIPNFPNLGNIPNFPNPGSIPNFPNPGSIPNFPNPGSIPNFPNPGSIPNFPNPGSIPNFPNPGSIPNFPNPGSIPNFPNPGSIPSFPSQPSFGGNPLLPFLNILYPGIPSVPTCPYTNIPPIPGYTGLRGRFDGCCEQNRCYIPRSQLATPRSGVANYPTGYGEYGPCSVKCGGGVQTRYRKCVQSGNNKDDCKGEMEQSRTCNKFDCPSWGRWGDFGSCSVTCGTGQRQRTRECTGGDPTSTTNQCEGSGVETEPCTEYACPRFGPWEREFGQCSVSCGKGQRTRTRPCVENCNPPTAEARRRLQESSEETSPCTVFCGTYQRTDTCVSACSRTNPTQCCNYKVECMLNGQPSDNCTPEIPRNAYTRCRDNLCQYCPNSQRNCINYICLFGQQFCNLITNSLNPFAG